MVKNSGVVLWGMKESRLRLLDLDDLEYKDEDFWKHEKSYRKSVKLEKKIELTSALLSSSVDKSDKSISAEWADTKSLTWSLFWVRFKLNIDEVPVPPWPLWVDVSISTVSQQEIVAANKMCFQKCYLGICRSIWNLLQTDPMSSLNEVSS